MYLKAIKSPLVFLKDNKARHYTLLKVPMSTRFTEIFLTNFAIKNHWHDLAF